MYLYLTLPDYTKSHEQNDFNAHSHRMPIPFISRFDINFEFWRSILLSRLARNNIPYVGFHMKLDTCCLLATIHIFNLQPHMSRHYRYIHKRYLWMKGEYYGAIFDMKCMTSILAESVFTASLFLELVFLSTFCSTMVCFDPSINNQKTGSCMKF